jgi:two-component sensor histidine kinase
MHSALAALAARTRALPTPVRYLGTALVVAGFFLIRHALDPVLPDLPYLLSFIAILLSATLFDRGSGYVATALSGAFAAYIYLPKLHSFSSGAGRDLMGLVLFLAVGAVMSATIEALRKALAGAQKAHADLARSEHARELLLHEIRHRMRNDLMTLQSLLLARARITPSEAAREGLQQAAGHALALARVHTRLGPAHALGDDGTFVDAREFVSGLCADLQKAQAGDGLRPVALIVEAEPHSLDTERAVQLGLVLNEAATNALKYAFPEERPGTVWVCFRREEDDFVLTVRDDGVGLLEDEELQEAAAAGLLLGSGLGTRLLQGLAAQLRGSFSRHPGPKGCGTIVTLRFPVTPPHAPKKAR